MVPVTVSVFLIIQVLQRSPHFNIKWLRGIILGDFFWLGILPLPFVGVHFLSDINGVITSFDILVNSEIWYRIVHWVRLWLIRMFILRATSRRTYWVRECFDIGIKLDKMVDMSRIITV